jgi:hypothetical protein
MHYLRELEKRVWLKGEGGDSLKTAPGWLDIGKLMRLSETLCAAEFIWEFGGSSHRFGARKEPGLWTEATPPA